MSSTKLLHVEVSPRLQRSHSRKLSQEFIATWRASHPQGQVIDRDLTLQPPSFISEAWVEGAFTAASDHSPEARTAIGASDVLVDELLAADEILIGTPIYNLSIPAALKAWIDQIVRFGRTFTRNETGLAGLLTGKRVRIIVSSGSDFRPEGPGGAYNHLDSYLRAVFGFIGITDLTFVYAHSLNAGDVEREQVLAEASAAAHKLAAAA
jgi:FMN-dependent NADH-azoreductase